MYLSFANYLGVVKWTVWFLLRRSGNGLPRSNRAAYGKERVILARRGKAVAAIVSLEDVELLEALEDQIDLENARAALIEAEKEGTVSWEEFKKELSL